jgi:hypothetical protein
MAEDSSSIPISVVGAALHEPITSSLPIASSRVGSTQGDLAMQPIAATRLYS